MTTEELVKLTPEEKRIRIAELCGWKWSPTSDYDAFYGPDSVYRGGATHDLKRAIQNAGLPDYLNDLNATHEAEKAIYYNGDIWSRYVRALARIASKTETDVICATAEQRSDAFLLAAC